MRYCSTPLLLVSLATAVLVFAGCASNHMRVADFSAGRPHFNPVDYFTGTRNSLGVMEDRRGEPTREVRTQTNGKRAGDVLSIEQALAIGAQRSHRSWKIRQLDANHFEATANDIIGTAIGEAHGNAFHWEFTLETTPGNPLSRVQVSQWMYLQPDGKTMLNHSTITKAGVVLAQVTEQFQ